MDKFIARLPAIEDGDLRLCLEHGVAYQADMSVGRVPYDDSYFDKYKSYEGSSIADALNRGRCALMMRHAPAGATVIDIGAGCGTFVQSAQSWGFDAKGFDVIQKTVEHLRASGSFAGSPAGFDVVTFWDSIEHIERPAEVLAAIRQGAVVLVAVPVFPDLRRVRESKHYRPGEHLYYWTASGFSDWMAGYGFRLLEESGHEVDAGRESIAAFAFVRDAISSHPCECGGEPQLEYFERPSTGIEWFMRCRECGCMGPSAPTAEGGRIGWEVQEHTEVAA